MFIKLSFYDTYKHAKWPQNNQTSVTLYILCTYLKFLNREIYRHIDNSYNFSTVQNWIIFLKQTISVNFLTSTILDVKHEKIVGYNKDFFPIMSKVSADHSLKLSDIKNKINCCSPQFFSCFASKIIHVRK